MGAQSSASGVSVAASQPTRPSASDVLAVVVVHVPHLLGYFSNRLAVVKLCLESLLRHKPAATQALVFDNGSCPQARRLLLGLMQDGQIDFLLRCRANIGTPAALRMVFGLGLRPVIAYSDDDVFFHPGWLEPELDILAQFPEAGMVSAVPTLDGADHAVEAVKQRVRADASVRIESEGRIPAAWEENWARSTGRDPEARAQLAQETSVPRISRSGVQAYVGATHFQYVGYAARLLDCLPAEWPNSLMGNMRDLDESIDRAGFLRLSTTQRHVQHMGNAVSDGIRREAAGMGLPVADPVRPPWLTPLEVRLERNRRVHGKIWVTYRHLGRLLDGEDIVPDRPVESGQQAGARDPGSAVTG